MDFNEFKIKLTQTTKQAFTEIYNTNETEDLYAFSLCNNDSEILIHAAANTTEHLEKVADEDDYNYYKYEPSEWKYSLQSSHLFDEVNEICKDAAERRDDDEDWFYNFQNQINDICVEVLEELKNENFFEKIVEKDIFLNFAVIEDDLPKQKQESIISKLNNQDYKEDYFEWMKSCDKNKKRAL